MPHTSANARLTAYLDRELSPELRAQVESHLLTCETCQADLRALQQTSLMMQTLPLTAPAPETFAHLHAAIDSAAARKPILAVGGGGGVERFIAILSGVAASLAVVGTLLLMQPRADASTVPTASAPWEHDAVRLSPADPAESAPENTIGQWMVANLSPRGGSQ